MLSNRDINLIMERMEYEEDFLSQVDELEFMDMPLDGQTEEPEEEKSFDYVIGEDDEAPTFKNHHEMEVYYYGDEDECWCDEYVPEYDPFDSLDEPYCYY